MRKLSKKQIRFLEEKCGSASTVEDLDPFQFGKLEEMNDYETLYQDVNRYLMDRLFRHKNAVNKLDEIFGGLNAGRG